MKTVCILPVPVLSPYHLKRDTFDRLDELPICAQYEDGAFVHIGTSDESDMPEDFRIVSEWIINHLPDSSWVRFDWAGDVVDGLPVYSSTWA